MITGVDALRVFSGLFARHYLLTGGTAIRGKPSLGWCPKLTIF
jgi:hypothetical protein